MEVSVVNAMPASARRLTRYLTTNAAATFVWTYLAGQVAKRQHGSQQRGG